MLGRTLDVLLGGEPDELGLAMTSPVGVSIVGRLTMSAVDRSGFSLRWAWEEPWLVGLH